MPEQYASADALGIFLTGAASDGGSQADPDLSFGNYRSSSYENKIGFFLNSSIPGIIVERVSGANGHGLGLLETISGTECRWTAPDDTAGEAVEIADGETKMLQSGGDTSKFIIISRNRAEELTGAATIILLPVFNNAVGSSNVPSGEALTKLRCLALKNTNAAEIITNLKVWIGTLGTQQISDAGQLGVSGAGTVETTGTFADWPASGFCRITISGGSLREIVYYSSRTDTVLTVPAAGRELLGTSAGAGAASDKLDAVPGIKIAKETPTDNHFTVCEDENDTDAVSGLSWSTGITAETGLDVGNLAAGEMIGIWIWLEGLEGRTASPLMKNILQLQWQEKDVSKTALIETAASAGFTLSPSCTAEALDLIEAGASAGFTLSPSCTAEILDSIEVEAEEGFTLSPSCAADIDDIITTAAEEGIVITPIGVDETLEETDRGNHRIADDSLERYELFRGVDQEPDLEGEPYETFSTLPHTTEAELSAETFFVLRKRNKFNLSSLNIKSWSVKLDADGDIVIPDPADPQNVNIVPAAGATGYVTAQYLYDSGDENAATHWLIYFTDDGSDPDPGVDEPTVVAMNKSNEIAVLKWTSPAADNEDILKVLVRTRAVVGEGQADSTNTDIHSCTASDEGPDEPPGRAFLGNAAEAM